MVPRSRAAPLACAASERDSSSSTRTTTCSDPPSSLCCKQHNALSATVCAKDRVRRNELTSTSSAVQTDGNAGGEAASCDVEASGHHGSTAALSLRAHPDPVLRKRMVRQRSKEPPDAQTGCCATSMTSMCPCAAEARGGARCSPSTPAVGDVRRACNGPNGAAVEHLQLSRGCCSRRSVRAREHPLHAAGAGFAGRGRAASRQYAWICTDV